MAKLPPIPQAVPMVELTKRGEQTVGRITVPWNLWLQELVKAIEDLGAEADFGSGAGGGVATSGGGPAVDLSAYPGAEGVSNLGARADHTHQRAIQAEQDDADLGAVQAIDILGPGLDVTVEPNITGSLLTDLWGRYPLNETTGTRYPVTGTAPSLAESGGAVSSAAGQFDLAASSVKTDTQYLEGSMVARNFDSGITIGTWVYLTSSPPITAGGMLSLYNSAGTDWIFLARYFDGNGVQFGFRSPGGVSTSAAIPVLPSADGWYPIMAWWDDTAKVAEMQVDNGPVYNEFFYPSTSVDITGWSFDRLRLMRGIGSQTNLHGRLDEVTIWERTLTASERALWFTSTRAAVEMDLTVLELYG